MNARRYAFMFVLSSELLGTSAVQAMSEYRFEREIHGIVRTDRAALASQMEQKLRGFGATDPKVQLEQDVEGLAFKIQVQYKAPRELSLVPHTAQGLTTRVACAEALSVLEAAYHAADGVALLAVCPEPSSWRHEKFEAFTLGTVLKPLAYRDLEIDPPKPEACQAQKAAIEQSYRQRGFDVQGAICAASDINPSMTVLRLLWLE